MNVVFTVVGQVIVDDEGHLLDVDAASEEIGGDEHTAAARAELAHNDFALVLIHVSMLKRAKNLKVSTTLEIRKNDVMGMYNEVNNVRDISR